MTMSSFSPKNDQGMIDCYQINYTTCHQLDGPKLSSHCSVDGGQRCTVGNVPPIFGPGSSFRVITDPRSDHNHVYDMPHRRSNQVDRRLEQVSDHDDVTVAVPVLVPVSMSVSNGPSQLYHHDDDEQSCPVSPPPSCRQPSRCTEKDDYEDELSSTGTIPHRIEFVHLFECS